MRRYESLNSLAPQYSREIFTKCSEGNGRNFAVVKQICRYLYVEHLQVETRFVIMKQNYGMNSVDKLSWHPPSQLSRSPSNRCIFFFDALSTLLSKYCFL